VSEAPPWLPPIVSTNGGWEEVLTRLYAIFDRDFKQGKPEFQGRIVFWDNRIPPGEKYEEGFWHLITKKEYHTGDRLLDPPRAERLPWCAPTIQHSDDGTIKVWDYTEGTGRVRTYVWLEDSDYLVILEKKKGRTREIAFLVTAYYVDGEGTRRSLKRKYASRF
jgi:hypothetical protein